MSYGTATLSIALALLGACSDSGRTYVSVHGQDELLRREGCSRLDPLEIHGVMEVVGFRTCNVRVDEDEIIRATCNRVPGDREHALELRLFVGREVPLPLTTTKCFVHMSGELGEVVDVDFTWLGHELIDGDGDGVPNIREVCDGTDPHDATE
jgi:hypothetical protein